jgi:hypothetical protein
MLTGLVRFPTSSGEVAARWVTPATFWQVLDHGDYTTMIRETRRARELGRRCRLRPVARLESGWRRAGRQELRVRDVEFDSLRNKLYRGHEGVRTDKGMRMD